MSYHYLALIEDDPDGGFLVRFEDVPEALTFGETREDAIASASEALGLALRGYCLKGDPLPEARATEGVRIDVEAADAIKLAVIEAFNESGVTKTELARRLGKAEGEARRILDPDHPTKLQAMQDALRVLGQTLVVSVRKAA